MTQLGILKYKAPIEKPVSYDASSILFSLNKIAIRRKLKVSKHRDECEQEADRLAEQVIKSRFTTQLPFWQAKRMKSRLIGNMSLAK